MCRLLWKIIFVTRCLDVIERQTFIWFSANVFWLRLYKAFQKWQDTKKLWIARSFCTRYFQMYIETNIYFNLRSRKIYIFQDEVSLWNVRASFTNNNKTFKKSKIINPFDSNRIDLAYKFIQQFFLFEENGIHFWNLQMFGL